VCTLAVALGTEPRFPVVVAANRDERLVRPSETWAVRERPRMAAPRDLLAGGTWIGVSARGVLAAVTNYHTGRAPDPTRRSRGELVGRALFAASAAEARAVLAATSAAEWNPFHLVVADAEQGLLWRYDGQAAALEPLARGLHVITESSADGAGPRGDFIRAHWPEDASTERLRALLSVHVSDPRAGTCIHMGAQYGTRSATILRLGRTPSESELLIADGPPCQSPFADRSELLRAL